MANPQKPDPSGVLLVRKYVELAAKLNTYLNHWPHHEKYGLAQQVRTTLYDCYKLMVEGHKRYHKKTTLTQLDVGHEQLRMLLYLAYELGYLAHHKGKAAPPNVAISEPCHRFASVYGPHTLAAARLSSPAPAS